MPESSMACPIGMPKTIHSRNKASMAAAARLMGGPCSELLLPVGAGKPAQPQHGSDHYRDHEDPKTGVDVVERYAKDHRLAPVEETDVVEHRRQRGQEDQPQGGGVDDGDDTLPARREFPIEHVEDDVLPLAQQQVAG